MDMATYTRESELNRRAYETQRESIRRLFVGKYVAIAHGKIVGADESFDRACAMIDTLDPVPEYYVVFPAEDEPNFGLALDLWGA